MPQLPYQLAISQSAVRARASDVHPPGAQSLLNELACRLLRRPAVFRPTDVEPPDEQEPLALYREVAACTVALECVMYHGALEEPEAVWELLDAIGRRT